MEGKIIFALFAFVAIALSKKFQVQNLKTFSHATGNAPLSYQEQTVWIYNSSGSALLTHYWFVGPYPGYHLNV